MTTFWTVALVISVVIYFLPSVVGNHKRNKWAIFTLNLLAGWTIVGWVVAMVWAVTSEQAPVGGALLCSECGSFAPAGTKFCPQCGKA